MAYSYSDHLLFFFLFLVDCHVFFGGGARAGEIQARGEGVWLTAGERSSFGAETCTRGATKRTNAAGLASTCGESLE